VKRRRTVLINYADGCCWRSQRRNCETGLRMGFDECRALNRSSLGADFLRRNAAILHQRRGAGFWSWKPYVILQTLLELAPGDLVFYVDAGAEFALPVEVPARRLLLPAVLRLLTLCGAAFAQSDRATGCCGLRDDASGTEVHEAGHLHPSGLRLVVLHI
jgi:hypothetical protein